MSQIDSAIGSQRKRKESIEDKKLKKIRYFVCRTLNIILEKI